MQGVEPSRLSRGTARLGIRMPFSAHRKPFASEAAGGICNSRLADVSCMSGVWVFRRGCGLSVAFHFASQRFPICLPTNSSLLLQVLLLFFLFLFLFLYAFSCLFFSF